MKKLFLFVLLCSIFSRLSAQNVGEQILKIIPAIDEEFRQFKTKNNLSSVSYALVLEGEIIHQNYDGIINHGTGKTPDPQSVYRIASMSKSFAGVAILQLRDQGKLQLDEPITKYIQELKGQKYAHDSPEITIRHLLTHAAGFPEDNPWGDRQLDISEQEMLNMFKKGISFSNEPGITYEYSNMAFAMLGYIIKQVSGQTYQTYIQEKIWKPLKMNSTYWDYRDVPEEHLVLGYRWHKGEFVKQPIEGNGAYGIMGGILTSTEDFVKYMTFHQKVYNHSSDNSPVLKKSSIKEMHFTWNFNNVNQRGFTGTGESCSNLSFYGYGLRIDKNCNNITMIGHSGGLPGYGSDWKILPAYNLGIVTLSNGTYGSAALLNNKILPLIIEKAGLRAYPFPVSPILRKRQEELLKLLPSWEKAQQSDLFAENFFSDYYLDVLKEETENAFTTIGKIIKVHEIVAENALRGTFKVEGEKGNLEVSFTMSPENPPLIQAYSIRKN